MTTQREPASQFTSIDELVRFNLRCDRVKFPASVLGVTFIAVYFPGL